MMINNIFSLDYICIFQSCQFQFSHELKSVILIIEETANLYNMKENF